MARFFFDVRCGSTIAEDEEGAEFPDGNGVEKEARAAVLELAFYKLVSGADSISIEVRDETGRHVLTASASVKVTREP